MLDQAFAALKSYDWGAELNGLSPIDEAIVATHGDAAGRRQLEDRLVAVLQDSVPRDAKDFVCRKLMQIGTAACVPTFAGLLPDAELSHMARYALERIPDVAAGDALREAAGKVADEQKIGILGSLGVRQEAASVPVLAELLTCENAAVANSAAQALGAIRSQEAADALASSPTRDQTKMSVVDASLACAEGLLAAGKKTAALAIYKKCAAGNPPKHVRLAATRGMLACAGS